MTAQRTAWLAATVAMTLAAAAPSVLAAGKLTFEDKLSPGTSSSVSVTVHRAAAFRVTLKAPTAGRTRVYLRGKTAPRGGALLDTKSGSCEGAAGSLFCRGAFEPLPAGTYTFKVAFSGQSAANVALTVRW